MGTSIKTSYPTNKEAMTVAVEAAAAIVVGAGEMVIWVGANIDATHRRADIQRALEPREPRRVPDERRAPHRVLGRVVGRARRRLAPHDRAPSVEAQDVGEV